MIQSRSNRLGSLRTVTSGYDQCFIKDTEKKTTKKQVLHYHSSNVRLGELTTVYYRIIGHLESCHFLKVARLFTISEGLNLLYQ